MYEDNNIQRKYRIGELDQRVQILAPTEAQSSGSGEVTVTWGEYATRYASVEPLGGNDIVISDMQQPYSRARFVMRYDGSITEKMRLVWNSHTYDINSINVIPRNMFLIIEGESYTLSGSDGVDYGNYYATNSLKIRQVTASAVTSTTPSQENISSDMGLTAVQAGAGYMAMIHIHALSVNILVVSDGTDWYYAYVSNSTSNLIDLGATAAAVPNPTEIEAVTGVDPETAGAGYWRFYVCSYSGGNHYGIVFSDGTYWVASQDGYFLVTI